MSGCPMMRIRNIENGDKLYNDSLFNRSVESTDCSDGHCNGSVMNPKYLTNYGELRPKAEVLSHAESFMEEYYNSLKMKDSPQHVQRWEEVRTSIQETGFYDLTYEELQFGAKTAWRNAPRCVGRRYWQRLEVFDGRNVKTAKEMFEILCKQIEYATNKGNLRSAITVFPHRTTGKNDCRVWNAQLMSYAGHKMPDGSILGDPINVEFTKICEKLGHKFEKTQYDILPLVLQAYGEDPEAFAIPKELVHEVEIRHPKYDIFEKMGLKWYALPAVANMLFDCGGMQFPGSPFNGWYMSTEIATRDFCDPHRLNIAEKIGAGMGYDTSQAPAMWKDRVVAEINYAVLESFKRESTTIVDHYTATETFMEHFQAEYKERGGCPADWVWIVPPLSGSLCPVFHQEMISYKLRPSYDYQIPAWKTHTWKKENPLRSNIVKRFAFKTVAKLAQICCILNKGLMAARDKCTIIFATETGKSAKFAGILANVFEKLFQVDVVSASDYFPVCRLASERMVLFVASTFGNGDPPGNAEKFYAELEEFSNGMKRSTMKIRGNGDANRNTKVDGESAMKSVRYGVFGLGSTLYPHYCAFGHTLDKLMADLGAKRCVTCGEGDEMHGQEDSFRKWCHTAFEAVAEEFYPNMIIDKSTIDDLIVEGEAWHSDNCRLIRAEHDENPPIVDVVGKISRTPVYEAVLKSRRQLQAFNSERKTILVSIDRSWSAADLEYEPGDHLAVFAPNPVSFVNDVIEWLQESDAENADEIMEFQNRASGGWVRNSRLEPCSIRMALTYSLDLCAPPQQSLLGNLSDLATDIKEQKTLKLLSQEMENYEAWKLRHAPTIAFLAKQFPSAKPPASLLLDSLSPILPRYYSISSSPKLYAAEVHLTVAVVEYSSNDGVTHKGMCSSFLNVSNIGTVIPCFVRKAPAFHLPEDARKPVVMVGPGTGIAPFRSFWQERHQDVMMRRVTGPGPMTLYFGCRSKDMDHIYAQEINRMRQNKTIYDFHLALSRQSGLPKTYVQDVMWDNRDRLFEHIVKENGHFYVCGDVQMAEEVVNMLTMVIECVGKMTNKEASDYLADMKKGNRFHEDIFGATSAHDKKVATDRARSLRRRSASPSKLNQFPSQRLLQLQMAL